MEKELLGMILDQPWIRSCQLLLRYEVYYLVALVIEKGHIIFCWLAADQF